MGPSGSGKSTLMHILAALDKPTSGSVAIAGEDVGSLSDTDVTAAPAKHIGFVFQFFNLLPMLTAEENIALPLSIAGEKPDKEFFEELLGTRRPRRPPQAPPGRALGRPAAARRDRALARLAADGRLRRRADRQPRLDDRRRDPRAAARVGRRVRPDDRDGHPRRRRGHDRRPHPVPRRRPDRGRARSDSEPAARSSTAIDGARGIARVITASRSPACSGASSGPPSRRSRSCSASR